MLYEKIQLEEGEEILSTVRKHWFIITVELVGVVFISLLPIFLLVGAATLPITPEISSFISEYTGLTTMIICSWLLINLMLGFTIWTGYYLDLWIITDRRIIVIDQIRFFNRKVSSFRLERLQDIKVTIKGLIPTLLNFGTVRAQTAGANESNFASGGMPDPREIQSTIQRSMDARLKVLGGTGATL